MSPGRLGYRGIPDRTDSPQEGELGSAAGYKLELRPPGLPVAIRSGLDVRVGAAEVYHLHLFPLALILRHYPSV